MKIDKDLDSLCEAYEKIQEMAQPKGQEMGLLVDFISEGGAPGSLEEGICCLVPKTKYKPYLNFTEKYDPDSIERLPSKDGFITYEELDYCVWKKAFTTDYAKLLHSVLLSGLQDEDGESFLDATEIEKLSIKKDQQSSFNSLIASGKWCRFKFKVSTLEPLEHYEDEDNANELRTSLGGEKVYNTTNLETAFDVFEPPTGIEIVGPMFTN